MKRNRIVLFALLAIAGLTVDLWTKHVMFSWPELLEHQVYWIVPDHAGFQLSLNEGGLFGMGQGSQTLLAAFSVLAAIAIPVWLFYFNAGADRMLTMALGGVMGGVLGNLYDRLG
ncbi:MAG: signal peptidase II, partial [Planctomycetales bacterium]|nr:signal peptidase II [Planctomycetales bacterium]